MRRRRSRSVEPEATPSAPAKPDKAPLVVAVEKALDAPVLWLRFLPAGSGASTATGPRRPD